MRRGRPKTKLRVAFLFTTFPVLTETFLQRQIRVLQTLPVDLSLYSLWGGARSFNGLDVSRYPKWRMLALPWWITYWAIRKPGACMEVVGHLLRRPLPSLLNAGETLIGLCFAIDQAHRFRRANPGHLHAVWSTMPASAAFLLNKLLDIPYSMGAHAYDVFEHGGDWLLREKIAGACFVHTSSEATRSRLLQLCPAPERIRLIRRGLDVFPKMLQMRKDRHPLRIISVGRMVEKMGYFDQLRLLAEVKAEDLPFEMRIVGHGRLRRSVRRMILELELESVVQLLGEMPFEKVLEQLHWADLFLFTGKVARSGDRPGLPNAVAEAMAVGRPVLATPVAGVVEAIRPGQTGGLIDWNNRRSWLNYIKKVGRHDRFYEKITSGARRWVEENFDATKTTAQLVEAFEELRPSKSSAWIPDSNISPVSAEHHR